MQGDIQQKQLGCFIIEDESFIEIRDCFIKSIIDIDDIQKQQQEFALSDEQNNIKSAVQEIEDCCFYIN